MASAKQYGSRYGIKPKKKLDKVFKLRQNAKKCPFCLKNTIKRLSVGIWFCNSCSNKFAAGAYTFNPKDFIVKINEADFLKDHKQEVKNESLEGFDEAQEVNF